MSSAEVDILSSSLPLSLPLSLSSLPTRQSLIPLLHNLLMSKQHVLCYSPPPNSQNMME